MNERMKIITAVILTAIIAGAAAGAMAWVLKPTTGDTQLKPGAGFSIFLAHAGDASDPFVVSGFSGATSTADSLGISIVSRYGGTDISSMVSMIQQAVAANYSAIITNIPDSIAFESTFRDAKSRGMIVIGYDDDAGTERQGFVGAGGLYQMGLTKGQWLNEANITENAKVLLAAEDSGVPWASDIIRGEKDYFIGINKTINWQTLEVGFETGQIEQRVIAYLTANPDTAAIMNTGMVSSIGTVLALEHSTNIQPGDKIFIGGISDPIDIRGIKEGYTNCAFLTSPASMGADAVLMAFNYWKYGILPRVVEHVMIKVDLSNADAVNATIGRKMF